MRKRNAGIILSIITATLVLAVGYAAVVDIPLSINGTASASSNSDNFNVQMVANSLDSAGTSTNITVEDKTTTAEKQLNVNFSAIGFSAKGDKAVVTYTIENKSNDLDAFLSSNGVSVTVPEDTGNIVYYKDGADLFDTSYYFAGTQGTTNTTISSSAGTNTTTVTVVITLNKTILEEENVVVNINLPITAKAQ